MKIRIGFISNSSSSSFLIYGTPVEGNGEDRVSIDKIENQLGEEKSFLELEYNPMYDSILYVGLSWGHIKDDETGKQFKERIEKEVKRIFKEEKYIFATYTDAWYNG